MSRDIRATIASETLQIIEKGYYTLNGSRIDISNELKYSIGNTNLSFQHSGIRSLEFT